MKNYKRTDPDKLTLSALNGFNQSDLYGIHKAMEVTYKGETVAVLMPYSEYLRQQKLILDSDRLVEDLAQKVCTCPKFGVDYNCPKHYKSVAEEAKRSADGSETI